MFDDVNTSLKTSTGQAAHTGENISLIYLLRMASTAPISFNTPNFRLL